MKLTASEIHVSYGPLDAVRGVSVEVQSGECVAVVGANGAGKSSLLAGIAGATETRTGTVTFDGEDFTSAPAHSRARRGLVLVPESRNLFPEMTVEDTLKLARAYARPGPWDLDTVYDLFPNLADRRALLAGNASGGEAQMLAIGRALMVNPSILMLDEPSAGLAPGILASLLRSIRGLVQEGLGILLVEQNVRGAKYMASRVLVMENGVVTRDGPPEILGDDESIRQSYLGR